MRQSNRVAECVCRHAKIAGVPESMVVDTVLGETFSGPYFHFLGKYAGNAPRPSEPVDALPATAPAPAGPGRFADYIWSREVITEGRVKNRRELSSEHDFL